MASESSWNYYRDKVNDDANEVIANNYGINNSNTTTSRSLEWKTKMIGRTIDDNNILDTENVVQLKYLNNCLVIFHDQ